MEVLTDSPVVNRSRKMTLELLLASGEHDCLGQGASTDAKVLFDSRAEADIRKVEHELASAEFLICQDIFLNETTQFAHVVLPAAAWSENDGTFTNSERRVSRVRTASPPPGVAKPNGWIFREVARRLYHYHTRTQTGRCHGLNDLLGEETCDISPTDARRLGIRPAEMVRVASRRGTVEVKARVTPEIPVGMVWMAFHFREGNANWLTNPAYDPETLTAEYKACAVRVEKV